MKRVKLPNCHANERRRTYYTPWSDLPTNLLHLVLNLLCFPDRIRFASVCAYWRSVAVQFHLLTLPSDCPWVIGTQSLNSNDCIFFSIEEKRYYELNIRADKRSTCWGSSEGWLMMAHPLTRKFLVNPISGQKVRLPPQNILPIKKFTVSSSPVSSTSAKVAVLHAHESRISSCLLGDKSWTNTIAEKSSKYDRYSYCDILIEEDGRGDCLAQKELDNSMVEEKTFLLKFENEIFMSVVTSTKEPRLLLKCYIYKNLDRHHWIPCNNLGDLTMFISTECSKIVVSNEGSIFRRNSVYYIDSGMRKLFEFCLDDGSSIDLKDFDDFYPRMWFFPST